MMFQKGVDITIKYIIATGVKLHYYHRQAFYLLFLLNWLHCAFIMCGYFLVYAVFLFCATDWVFRIVLADMMMVPFVWCILSFNFLPCLSTLMQLLHFPLLYSRLVLILLNPKDYFVGSIFFFLKKSF